MWVSVALPADAIRAEVLSETLLARGAISVSIEDAWAGTALETPQFGEPGDEPAALWQQSRVVALFEPSDDLAGRIALAAHDAGFVDIPNFTLTEIAEQNWVQLTQSQFEPIRINERMWIVPSWHIDTFEQHRASTEAHNPDRLFAESDCILQLDPGMAFGTGSHPTTRLCLEWLSDMLMGGETVLDYGCGSGILAIAAAKLGALAVLGVDIDDKALEAAHHNAHRNNVLVELRHSRESLDKTFDIVVANILTNPLKLLAPLLAGCLAPGGKIALSGILAAQADSVVEAYRPFVALRCAATLEGWCRLEGRAP
jgi:ribosomal protein L11 methyltransferase